MLNVWHKDKDTRYIRYRTGYIKEESTQVPFKFYRLSDTEIQNAEYLKGIEMQSVSFTIRTMFQYEWTVHTKVIIGNRAYKVGYVHKEEDDTANGILRSNVKPYIYLGLVG